LDMAASPRCTDETLRPGMQARLSVASLAALAKFYDSSARRTIRRATVVGMPTARCARLTAAGHTLSAR
jgi:hypothetical protein